MPSEQEIPVLLRKFDGVDIATDSAFIGPSYLQSSQNWIPDPTHLLTKRPGSALYRDLATDLGGTWSGMFGIKHVGLTDTLYVVASPTAGTEKLYASVAGAAFTAVPSGDFASNAGYVYGFAVLGGNLYVGSGLAPAGVPVPIKQIPFGGTAVDLIVLPTFVDVTAAPTSTAITTDSLSNIQAGLYTYRWAIYNNVTMVWVSIGTRTALPNTSPNTVTITGAELSSLSFTSPVAGLAANQAYHLFVAPVNLPIEFAHDQTPEGVRKSVV